MGWRLFQIIAIAAAVSGCTKTVDEMSYSEVKEYAAQMVEQCKKQGVPANELEACAKQEMRADQSRRMKQRQIGEAIAEAGADIQRSSTMNQPVNCTSTANSSWVGGPVRSVRTTCY